MRSTTRTEPFDYDEYQHVQGIVSGVVGNNPDVFVIRKDLEELVLIMKGNSPEYLQEDCDFLLDQIERRVNESKCTLSVGAGAPRSRIADIGQSFIEALASVQKEGQIEAGDAQTSVDTTELLKVDKSAVEDYLKCGVMDDFDDFFDVFIFPLGQSFKSSIVKNYIFLDIVFTAVRFVTELGGEIDQVLPGLEHVDAVLTSIKTIDEFKEQAQLISRATRVPRLSSQWSACGRHSASEGLH